MAEKKEIGATFSVDLITMMNPMIGRVVQIKPDGEEQVTARIADIDVENNVAILRVVSDNTME